jgi:heterotetrameric sarcosine oxidase delta subunit
MLIPCPYCGDRDAGEFEYGGDATVRRPSAPNATPEDWYRYLYCRDNPRGLHTEYWQHTHGCRSWFVVRRDTLSHELHGSGFIDAIDVQGRPGEATAT